MADILTQNGLSIGGVTVTDFAPQAVPSIYGTGTNPAETINRAMAQMQQVALLQYPTDLPKYYMGFKIMSYSRNDLMSVAQTSTLNQICLPFPDQMVDTNQVAYDQVKFSATIGAAVNAGFPIAKQAVNNAAGGNPALQGITPEQSKKFTTGTLEGLGEDALKGVFGSDGIGVQGAAGYSPNYFLTVVLSGPQYKRYSLSWTFAPRSPAESAALRQINRVFSDAQAPGMTQNQTLFTFPRVFQNYFAPNPGFLYQFKPSVLINYSVNYTPGGMPSMKQNNGDPILNGWNAPTAMRVQADFLELEFWLRGDFGDVTEGARGAQEVSNQIVPTPGNRTAP